MGYCRKITHVIIRIQHVPDVLDNRVKSQPIHHERDVFRATLLPWAHRGRDPLLGQCRVFPRSESASPLKDDWEMSPWAPIRK